MAPAALKTLVLASGSPRRRDLLQGLGIAFERLSADIDETPHSGELASPYVARLALEKAQAVAKQRPDALILAADTTVVLDQKVLGKPADAQEACQMLASLSGRSHEVLTAIALWPFRKEALVVSSKVHIRNLSTSEIEWYVGTGEPLDKAGSYALQGKGSFLVQSVEGSPTNVIGLPLVETLAWLKEAGLPLAWS